MSQGRSTMRSRAWVWWLPCLYFVCTAGCSEQAKPPSGVEETPERDESTRIDLSSDDDPAPAEVAERPTDDTTVVAAVVAMAEATNEMNSAPANSADAAAPSTTPDTSEVASEPNEGHFVPEPNEAGNGGSAGENAATGGSGGSLASGMGGQTGKPRETKPTPESTRHLDPTPGPDSCPEERPEHGAECIMAVGTGCFYPLEKCVCGVDPDGKHRWECTVTDCPLNRPAAGDDCSATQTQVCSYDSVQCVCTEYGWHCQGCFVEPPHYFNNYNHCIGDYCPLFPCVYGDGWVCDCNCTWTCEQR